MRRLENDEWELGAVGREKEVLKRSDGGLTSSSDFIAHGLSQKKVSKSFAFLRLENHRNLDLC